MLSRSMHAYPPCYTFSIQPCEKRGKKSNYRSRFPGFSDQKADMFDLNSLLQHLLYIFGQFILRMVKVLVLLPSKGGSVALEPACELPSQ